MEVKIIAPFSRHIQSKKIVFLLQERLKHFCLPLIFKASTFLPIEIVPLILLLNSL